MTETKNWMAQLSKNELYENVFQIYKEVNNANLITPVMADQLNLKLQALKILIDGHEILERQMYNEAAQILKE